MTTGRDAEREFKAILEDVGYRVWHPPKAKFREQDIFGLFDLLAFGKGRLEGVQVKASRDAAGIREWFEEARQFEHQLAGFRVAFAHRKDGEWRLARAAPDGYRWVYDGREDKEPYNLDLRDWFQ